MRGVDVVVLLGLLRHRAGEWTVRMLARELQMPLASVQRSIVRLSETPAFDPSSRRVEVAGCEELFEHGICFLAPAITGGRARGVPTAWALPTLSRRLRPGPDAPQPVWPQRGGAVTGAALRPLHASAPALAAADPEMHMLLALADASRLGEDRVRRRAAGLLRGWLASAPAAGG